MATISYGAERRDNEKFARMINAAWGAEVAWVEDREFGRGPVKYTMPVIVSRMVGGLVPGLTPPPFKDRIGPRLAA